MTRKVSIESSADLNVVVPKIKVPQLTYEIWKLFDVIKKFLLQLYYTHLQDISFYRLDNMVLHPTEPVAVGVLDWELSTIGDPITDLVTCCLGYYTPAELSVLPCKFYL